jgi:hypothetical protein
MLELRTTFISCLSTPVFRGGNHEPGFVSHVFCLS